MTHCTGGNLQYESQALCMASCLALPAGMPADVTGNTRGCREHFAGLAATDAPANCMQAGPGGGGVCGNWCDHYCDVVQNACPGTFATNVDCQAACADLLTNSATPVVTTGDTLQCRVYHAQVALETPTPHCAHVTVASSTCTDVLPANPNSLCAVAEYVTRNPPQATPVEVALNASAFTYTPKCLKVRGGTSVTIAAEVNHPLVGSGMDSPWTAGSGTPVTAVLNTPGVFPYECGQHGPFGMVGAVWVVP